MIASQLVKCYQGVVERVGLFEAKNKLSEICERVATRRMPIAILRRGKPLVRIVPIDDATADDDVWSSRERVISTTGPLQDEIELPQRRRDRRLPPFIDGKGR